MLRINLEKNVQVSQQIEHAQGDINHRECFLPHTWQGVELEQSAFFISMFWTKPTLSKLSTQASACIFFFGKNTLQDLPDKIDLVICFFPPYCQRISRYLGKHKSRRLKKWVLLISLPNDAA